MGERKVTRYYYETLKYDYNTKKTLFARRRLTKTEAEKILSKARFSFGDFGRSDDESICVKHVGKRKAEKYDQNWYVIQKKATIELDCFCDEGLEI